MNLPERPALDSISIDSLPDRFHPSEIEGPLNQWWESQGYLKAEDCSTKPPYSIVLPPPNVTGNLHIGHALNSTLQDLVIRFKRMQGFNVLWMPGTDHAGIATQSVVERNLKAEGLHRKTIGREEFVKKVWAWKNQFGNQIVEQLKGLGASCDWDRLTFTLDAGVSRAVRKVFVSLYQKKSIYRGLKLVNWSAPLETAVSDLEVEYKEVTGHLWHIRYPLTDPQSETTHLIIATTRPETLLGDTAICVHPTDERYQAFVGKTVQLPLCDRAVPIIADPYVETSFGSGVVKITPAHDFNDYKIALNHKLPLINILNKDGTLNSSVAAKYQGLSVSKAREAVVKDLESLKLIQKVEPYRHSVGFCSRSGSVIEPLLSEQWFMSVKNLAAPARAVVESGTIIFEPESWTKTYLHWMSIIEDWCISRQLWWGHRIPAWYCQKCDHVTVKEEDPSECEKCGSNLITQDEDVLDTWFSSALWPFSTMGWPKATETLKTFYPTNLLVTGHDIIFFWVARMIMMGLEFVEDVPFRKVLLHGLIRDIQGEKMSKSKDNSIDPLEMIKKYGADALRFTLLSQASTGRDLKFSEHRIEGYRNFMNKIWNAARFSLSAMSDFVAPADGTRALPSKSQLSATSQWMTYRLADVEKKMQRHLESFAFSEAAKTIYLFVWNDFCDWYLEFIKPVIYGNKVEERKTTQLVLAQTLNRIVRLLHPFTPFITESIYQKLPIRNESVMVDEYPSVENDQIWLSIASESAAFEIEAVKEVITAIRNIRGENRVSPAKKIKTILIPEDDHLQKIMSANKGSIQRLAGVDECEIGPNDNYTKCAVQRLRLGDASLTVVVPLEGLVDLIEELNRISKEIGKVQKNLQLLSVRLSNESYLSQAPKEIVEADKARVVELKEKLASLDESRNRLS